MKSTSSEGAVIIVEMAKNEKHLNANPWGGWLDPLWYPHYDGEPKKKEDSSFSSLVTNMG